MTLAAIKSLTRVRPVILLTGFLGAGKTTLLKRLLTACQEEALHTDVILNDFADANLDCATIEGMAESIEALSAGCACCEGLDFLLKLSLKTNALESDLLFVELNGTADPVPIIEAFTLLEERLQLHPRWQVCVIDTRHFGERGFYRDIEELQLQTASHLYLSHTGGGRSVEEILAEVRKVNAHAPVLSDEELVREVLALGRARRQRLLTAPAQGELELATLKKSAQHEQTHDFHSAKIVLPAQAEEQKILNWLNSLPASVLRVKMLMGVQGKPGARYLYERVGMEVSRYPQRVELGPGVENSVILIGPNLPLAELEQSAREYFGK
ncbi:GTP-binding protein [Verrucomicrobiaceae bacterium R5-34]|nr:GTP-binding protein [Verrucomicrobiaceae bacterium R5-34]